MADLPAEATDRARARVGQVLNRKYRLDALVGVGGMAAVYASTHRNGNRVAVKLLHPELSLNSDILARFVREGYVANRVEHPGTVRVLDDDRAEDGSVFLVMELLAGDTLDHLWERSGQKMRPEDVLHWMNQTLDVLAAAHIRGIVHRDIKPENLFLTTAGQVKVLDFGIARLREGAGAAMTATRTGMPFGTPAFMSPEQALGRTKEIDARTDVYGVGATMFAMLTGKFVQEAETAAEMTAKTAMQPARSIRQVAPDLPDPIALIVDRALAFTRDDRWADARAMQQALEEAYLKVWARPLPPLASSPLLPTQPEWRAVGSAPSFPALVEPVLKETVHGVPVARPGPLSREATTTPGEKTLADPPAAAGRAHAPDRNMERTAPPTSRLAGAMRGRGSRRWLPFAIGAGTLGISGIMILVLAGRPSGRADPGKDALPSAQPAAASTSPGAPASSVPPPAATTPPATVASTASPSASAAPGPDVAVPPRRVSPVRPAPRPRPHPSPLDTP